uniref:podocalyxin-like protein 2 n=1 Tax=Pristiophorus japonicus TaxID=55135 RepID=UPI00398F290B
MTLHQSLLCGKLFYLGSLCLFLALAEEADTGVFTAVPGIDPTIVSYLDLMSAEVETDGLRKEGPIVGGPAVELSPGTEGFREESNSSQSEPSWNAESPEEPGASSDGSSSVPLLPSAPLPVAVTGESDAVYPFTSLPQPMVSPGAESMPSGRPAEPATSPTNATFSRPSMPPVSLRGGTADDLDDPAVDPTAESDSGGRRDEPDAPPTGTNVADVLPANASGSPAAIPASSSSSPPPQLPDHVGPAGAITPPTTATTGSDAALTQGLPITGEKGTGFATPDPDHTTAVEAESKMEEPGFIPEDTSGTKPTAARGEPPETTQQVVCRDWSKLAGKSYVILNMTENTECEVFRSHKGLQLLEMVAESFSSKLSTPADSWRISLSKPSEDDKHLLMMLASDRGTIPAKEVLAMLGDVKESLKEIGIHNVTSATGCQGRPSQPRGDYGKLFIVLVIIGSICAVIIVSGLVYICWQRRLPKLKNMSHGEELHFVENGCHDNPTLDITIDSTSEMQEKKPSVNGDAMERSGGWNALITKGSKDEPDSFEEDTHL